MIRPESRFFSEPNFSARGIVHPGPTLDTQSLVAHNKASMHRVLSIAAVFLCRAMAQPTFEVASIKPQHLAFDKPGSVGIRLSGNRLHAETQTLAGLVMFAYGVEDFQVSGG